MEARGPVLTTTELGRAAETLALARLERQGWITPIATEARRRPYQITAAGRSVLAQQLQSMREIARVGQARTRPARTASA